MKRTIIWNLLLSLMVFALLIIGSCKKDDPNVAPNAITLSAPSNLAEDIVLNTVLSWQAVIDPDGDEVTYDVYLDTDPNPEIVVSTDQKVISYSTTLAANTTYYWKIVAKDNKKGASESDVWSFTTEPIAWSDATHGTFTDKRDGKVYNVIKIGDQTWFAENLAYETQGKEITDNAQWMDNTAYDGWCYFDNDESTYGSIYGIIYQFEAAKTAPPSDWHVPTDDEWTILTEYLLTNGYLHRGIEGAIAKSLASATEDWSPIAYDLIGAVGFRYHLNNSSGFTGLPGGSRLSQGTFHSIGNHGGWWSSTELPEGGGAWRRYIAYNDIYVNRFAGNNLNGFYVRCLMD